MVVVDIEFSRLCILGRGSYGTVYLAKFGSFLFMALKTAVLENSFSLVKEETILKQFSDCNEIVRCFGGFVSFEGNHRLYNVSLEYAAGGTLRDLIIKNKGGKLAEPVVRAYTRMLLKGLSSIHEKGFVHCDLKPGNILVFPRQEQDGLHQLKIADLGLAKVPGEEKQYGDYYKHRFRGTPAYMSPESVALGEIKPPLDIWSLGCIVIEMLTGKLAWQLYDEVSLMFQLAYLKEAPNIPEKMSETGKDFLNMCFLRNPIERWTADMLLSHPFMLDEDQPSSYYSLPESLLSPTSPLDHHQSSPISLPPPGWCSFISTCSLPSICDDPCPPGELDLTDLSSTTKYFLGLSSDSKYCLV